MSKTAKPNTKKTINQKIEELNKKTEWFYGNDFELDQAAAHYRAAVELSKEIENDLNHLKNEIEIIDQDFAKTGGENASPQ